MYGTTSGLFLSNNVWRGRRRALQTCLIQFYNLRTVMGPPIIIHKVGGHSVEPGENTPLFPGRIEVTYRSQKHFAGQVLCCLSIPDLDINKAINGTRMGAVYRVGCSLSSRL